MVLINALNTWFGSVVGAWSCCAACLGRSLPAGRAQRLLGGCARPAARQGWSAVDACLPSQLLTSLPAWHPTSRLLLLLLACTCAGCESFHADVHAGNLLVLPDGRVAFIDFGIVGRIR